MNYQYIFPITTFLCASKLITWLWCPRLLHSMQLTLSQAPLLVLRLHLPPALNILLVRIRDGEWGQERERLGTTGEKEERSGEENAVLQTRFCVAMAAVVASSSFVSFVHSATLCPIGSSTAFAVKSCPTLSFAPSNVSWFVCMATKMFFAKSSSSATKTSWHLGLLEEAMTLLIHFGFMDHCGEIFCWWNVLRTHYHSPTLCQSLYFSGYFDNSKTLPILNLYVLYDTHGHTYGLYHHR